MGGMVLLEKGYGLECLVCFHSVLGVVYILIFDYELPYGVTSLLVVYFGNYDALDHDCHDNLT